MDALAFACDVRTYIGPRSRNEDSAYASGRLAAVADGVGGSAAGEVASRAAIDALIALDKRYVDGPVGAALRDAVVDGNGRIRLIAECRPETTGMATTLTAVALADDGTYIVANIGDSRTYLFRDGDLALLTRDETYVQSMIESGKLAPEDAARSPLRSAVLRALDGGDDPLPQLRRMPARRGDRLLLCSDGLTDYVDVDAIARTLRTPSRAACADRLIALAQDAGSRDNVSAVVVDAVPIGDVGERWGAASRECDF